MQKIPHKLYTFATYYTMAVIVFCLCLATASTVHSQPEAAWITVPVALLLGSAILLWAYHVLYLNR